MTTDFGSATSGPRRAFLISSPILVGWTLARARRRARRMPGLTPDQRQALVASLSKHQSG